MQPGLSLGDRYTLTGLLGTGDHTKVYAGHDTVRDRPVRIKALADGTDPDAYVRFRRSAMAVAALDIPGVVDIIDCVEHRDGDTVTVCQIATAIDGVPLSRLLDDGLGIGTEEILDLIAATAWAVHEAREAGVRHLNLKPANVFVGDGAVTVADFGYLAVPTVNAYTAPESRGGSAPGPTADSYALGAIAYECITGRQPSSPDPLATLPSGTLPAVVAFLDRALSPTPQRRFPTAGALATECEQINHTNDVLGALLARDRTRPVAASPGAGSATAAGAPNSATPSTAAKPTADTGAASALPRTGSGLDAPTTPLNAAEVSPPTAGPAASSTEPRTGSGFDAPATPPDAAAGKPSSAGATPNALPRTGSGSGPATAPLDATQVRPPTAGPKPSAGTRNAGPRTGSGLNARTTALDAAGVGASSARAEVGPRGDDRSATPRPAAGGRRPTAPRPAAGPRKHADPAPGGRGRRVAVLVAIAVLVVAGVGVGIAALGPQGAASSAADGGDPDGATAADGESGSDSTSPTPSATGKSGSDQVDGPSNGGSSGSSGSSSSKSTKPDEPDDTDDEPDPPAKVKVPDVIGDARPDAVDTLEDAELEVKVSKTGEGEYECPIEGQDPEAGKSVVKGSTVTIELRLAADEAACGSGDGGDGGQTSPVTEDEAVATSGPAAARRPARGLTGRR